MKVMGTTAGADYRPEVDGLRAVAVLAVVLFHAELGCPGGFVGVDVFFVISGFLITGLLRREWARGEFRLGEFWVRRVRRLGPALALVVGCTLAVGWGWLLPVDYERLGKSVVAVGGLVPNIFFWKQVAYFTPAAEAQSLLHTWSLGVEEQFYLLFPLVWLAGMRWTKGGGGWWWVVGACSFGLCVYGSYRFASANFYLLPTRAWELLLGVGLAMSPGPGPQARRWAELLGWLGLLAVVAAVAGFDRATRFPGWAALVPCLGTALVLWANTGGLVSVGRVLAWGPLVFVGLISYSLYLWHWPVLSLAKYLALEPWSAGERGLLVLGCVGLAAGTWRWVELPVRQRRWLGERRWLLGVAAVTAGVLSLAGAVIAWRGGVPERLPVEVRRLVGEQRDDAGGNRVDAAALAAGRLVELGGGGSAGRMKFLLWGDSHAYAVQPVLEALAREHGVRGGAVTWNSTPPVSGYPSNNRKVRGQEEQLHAAVVEFVRRERVAAVVLVANWNGYLRQDDENPERLRAGLRQTVRLLTEAGARVWILAQVPRQRKDIARVLPLTLLRGRDPAELGTPRAEQEEMLRRQAPIYASLNKEFPQVRLLDPTGAFSDLAGRCQVVEGGRALYFDSSHLSPAGALKLRPLFAPIFSASGAAD